MAAQGSKKNTNKQNKGKPVQKKFKLNKQLTAILLFALSVLWLCLAIIDAGGLWGACRTLIFGVFGFCAFIFPLLLIVTAIVIALEKSDGKFTAKIIEVLVIITIICSIVFIFNTNASSTYFTAVKEAYNVYKIDGSMLGSGVLGALIGGVFLLITGGSKTAALVIEFLLLFVFIMVVTGMTLANLVRGISRPVKKISQITGEKISEYGEKAEQHHEEKEKEKERKKRRFNPDVDLGPEPPENPEPLFADDKSGEDELLPFSDVTGKNIDVTPVEQQEGTDEKVINLDDIIRKNSIKTDDEAQDTDDKDDVFTDDEELEENDPEYDEFGDPIIEKPYVLPSLECLSKPKNGDASGYENELRQNAEKLVDTLNSFGVETRIVDIARGPSVTRYEIQPAAGVKISKITNLADDIALNLAASGVRIEAPIPNKAAVGIEIPNRNRQMVTLREVIDQQQYRDAKSKLTVGLGKDITGQFVYSDLVKMPHLLIAGTTGSGKSVCLNTMIVSILYNATPDEVKLLMIDPKQVEFTIYNGIPHLLVPVVSDPRKASGALAWAVTEMLTRYKTFSENNVRDISGYNSICEGQGKKKMPQIVIFIDELSDLMMAAPNEVEDSICRLAQMARAAGMHLVIATQRPSVDVITGIIKANIPSRISLSVSSQVDSRTIIDSVGAEKLLGNGDMLYYPVGIPKPIRVQGCYLSDKEVENVVTFIKNQEKSEYDDDVMKEIERQAAASSSKKKDNSSSADDGDEEAPADEMLPKAIEVVVEAQSASTTLLQRKLKLGYARAARIVDELEQRGIIGPYEGSKPRRVLVSKQQWYEMNAMAQGGADKPYGTADDHEGEGGEF
ncbi:MAG: DNA translocase FtsK [Oscillospiraceae bacterium]|nr:DNA translocase FtsK [Oscillospiraceae bacterium]